MSQRTANTAEVCRRSISGDTEYFPNDIFALRRVAVENVKQIITRQHKTNSIMAEWLQAKEDHKKGSVRR